MTVRFEQILAEGVAQCSYLLGDDAAGTAAVVDPRPDIGVYLDWARRHGLTITHVFETHIHADFLSGARELVDRLAGAARLYVSGEGGAEYGFRHHATGDGDEFRFGDLKMTARFTPGHTPEHLSFLLGKADSETPWGVLSGDCLFADSVGRPDLLGDDKTEELTEALFDSIHDVYLKLDDGVAVYPGHAAGSACGPDIGDRMHTTVGYERRHNPYLQIKDREKFKQALLDDAPPVPTHYPRLKKLNSAGPRVLGNFPKIPAMGVEAFADATENGAGCLLDTRDMAAFGGGYAEGALNIAARPELSMWAGWLVDPEEAIYLVLEDDRMLRDVSRLLWRVGLTNFGGYLAGGISSWREAGMPLREIRQMPVHEIQQTNQDVLLLDVRKDEEWAEGHIPGARHIFLGELRGRLNEMDRDRPVATYCASGFRASIAASILAANGFKDVRNVPGSWLAWTNAGFKTEN